MNIDDAVVKARLGAHPEFLARLHEFIDEYGLQSRPALILQARARTKTSVDLSNSKLREMFQRGERDGQNWWRGFRSSFELLPTFHGIAAVSDWGAPQWANEMHGDGHFIAGIWRFPSAPFGDNEVLAVADFHSEVFRQFFDIVKACTAGGDGLYDFTATLSKASSLHYMARADWGSRHVIRAKPLPLDVLQWPVRQAAIGSDDYAQVGESMGAALRAAYHDDRPLRGD